VVEGDRAALEGAMAMDLSTFLHVAIIEPLPLESRETLKDPRVKRR
jgi:hypothetical protein